MRQPSPAHSPTRSQLPRPDRELAPPRSGGTLGTGKTPIDCGSSEDGPYPGHVSILPPSRITSIHRVRVLSFVLNACAVQRLDANSLGTRLERFPRDRSDLPHILKHRLANDHLLLEMKRFVRRLPTAKFLGRAVRWRRNLIVRTMNHAALTNPSPVCYC